MVGMKKCKQCGMVRYEMFFYKSDLQEDGLYPWCDDCFALTTVRKFGKTQFQKDFTEGRKCEE